LPAGRPVVLVAENADSVAEARTRLARVGVESVAGFLEGGIAAWDSACLPLAKTEQVSVDELAARIADRAQGQVVDVRRAGEWNAGHIAGAVHIPLSQLAQRFGEIDRTLPTHVVCAGGFRSSIATSLLEQQGFPRVTNVVGGMGAWTAAKLPTVS
jgi:hydroxyacylglutathione hydrolase